MSANRNTQLLPLTNRPLSVFCIFVCAHVCCICKTQSHSRTQTHTAFCACGCTQDCLPMRPLLGISWPPFPDFTHSLTDSWFLSFIKRNTICNDRRGFEWKQNKPRPTSLRQGVGFPVYLHPIFDIFPPPPSLLSCLLYYASKQNGRDGVGVKGGW